MNIEEIRDFCLDLEGTEESTPFGPNVLVFKVRNKMYALLPLDNETVSLNLKNTPSKNIELREKYTEVKPGYHMNKTHWNTITVEGNIESEMLKRWIVESYEMIKQANPKKR